MPKYTSDMIAGYVLCFTSKCIVEAMHIHAGDKKMNSVSAAKIFVFENGDTKVERWGTVNETDMKVICDYIKNNHTEMYKKWINFGGRDYYGKRK